MASVAGVHRGAPVASAGEPHRVLLQPGWPLTLAATLSQVEVSRRVTLEKLPPVLVLHLKRFVYEKTGGCQKLVKNIDYPVDLEISRGNAGLCPAAPGACHHPVTSEAFS